MEKELQAFGLTKNEAKVYLTVLDLGSSLAGVVARKSGIHRRSVYDALDRLIEKGLIGYIVKNNRKYFEVVDPNKFNEIVKEKEAAAKEIVPILNSKYNLVKEKQETSFFRGKNGLKSVFEDQLRVRKPIYIFGAVTGISKFFSYYLIHFNKRRRELKVPVKIIFRGEDRGKVEKTPLVEIRYMPRGHNSFASTSVYGDRVAIILWSENPYAIVIKDEKIAESYLSNFEFMWKNAKK
ncbi:MAG: hypothetical protein HYS32_01140 [Candidatus Woesearchaeota archaeon]|nr:MAG: hypothetical protein HYS32_01140 [Candidatus Woesearchaeota archaeon]